MTRLAPTTMELTGRSTIVVVPLGSWEQHGPHLPLDTDTIIIDAVVLGALKCVSSSSAIVVAPTLAITASDEHAGFAGSLSMGTDATRDALVAIGRSATWASGICFANGHGGNADALTAMSSALSHEGIRHSTWSLPSYGGSDMHAGLTETSLMLHIAPERVRHDLITPGAEGSRAAMIANMRTSGVRAVSPNGIIGDPTAASAAHGAEVLALYTQSLTTHLDARAAAWSSS